MAEVIQEFVSSARERLRVDRDAGVIRGVKLLGLQSRNGRRYREGALREAVSLYDGAKVNVNHPKGHPLAPRDYQDRLGVIRAARFRIGEGLFGDLHFNPKHPLSEQLAWDAEHAPRNVGLSHNVLARTSAAGGETVVEAITKVQSIDLVADPATTDGLFEHVADARGATRVTDSGDAPVRTAGDAPTNDGPKLEAPNFEELTLEALTLHRPDLVREIRRGMDEELDEARAALEKLSAREATARRRARIVELLEEHRLPIAPGTDVVDSWVVGPRFMESLMRAEDETELRALISERAELVRSASSWGDVRAGISVPRSRGPSEGQPRVTSGAEFAAAIRGR